MSVEEINQKLKESFYYNEYEYQKENGILIKEETRAEGLHKILYKCPACRKESMASDGTELYCKECGKRWFFEENGELTSRSGETEFKSVPEWFEWERAEVRAEILAGTYSFSDTVDVHSLPRCNKFEPLGNATLTHTAESGFILEGFYRGEKYSIQRKPLETNSLHVEYDFPHIKPFDCVDISTEKDSFYCFPEKENVVTKLSLATEEIYKIHLDGVREARRRRQNGEENV